MMNFPHPGNSAKDEMRNRQNMLMNLANMTIMQLINAINNAKEKKSRDNALKALLQKVLSPIKSLLSKSVSVQQASDINALGNAAESAKSAGNVAFNSVK